MITKIDNRNQTLEELIEKEDLLPYFL